MYYSTFWKPDGNSGSGEELGILMMSDSDQLWPTDVPNDHVTVIRPLNRSCGSGSYYKEVQHPYPEYTRMYFSGIGSATFGGSGSRMRYWDPWSRSYDLWDFSQHLPWYYTIDIGSFALIGGYTEIGVELEGTPLQIRDLSYHCYMLLHIAPLGKYRMLSIGGTVSNGSAGNPNWLWGDGKTLSELVELFDATQKQCGRSSYRVNDFESRQYWSGYDAEGYYHSCSLGTGYGGLEHIGNTYSVNWKYDTDMRANRWFSYITEGILPGELKTAVSEAYTASGRALPEVSANSVANLFEVAESLTSVSGLIRQGSEVVADALKKRAKQALDPREDWLTWRYVYNTTKLDISDYKSVTSRLINLAGTVSFKTHGWAETEDHYLIKVTDTWNSVDFDVESYDTKRLLDTYGFKLSAYNAWDMVPFSFMADWFLHVGDWLERHESWNHRREFQPQNTWCSCRRTTDHGYVYFRWANLIPSTPPIWVEHSASSKQLSYRVADTISIFSK